MAVSLVNDPVYLRNDYYLTQSFLGLYNSLAKLSSGFRINSAADNPAGLVISEQLRSQIGSLEREINNYSDLIGKYQVASSTVSGLRAHISDLRELAIGASNEAFNSPEAQQAYATAAQSLVNTYNTTIADAEYNGRNLLDGSEGSLAKIDHLEGVDLSNPQAASDSVKILDEAASKLDTVQSDLGSTQKNELQARMASLYVTRENLIASESQIRDTDFVSEYTNFVIDQFRFKAGLALLSHYGISSRSVLELLKSN